MSLSSGCPCVVRGEVAEFLDWAPNPSHSPRFSIHALASPLPDPPLHRVSQLGVHNPIPTPFSFYTGGRCEGQEGIEYMKLQLLAGPPTLLQVIPFPGLQLKRGKMR